MRSRIALLRGRVVVVLLLAGVGTLAGGAEAKKQREKAPPPELLQHARLLAIDRGGEHREAIRAAGAAGVRAVIWAFREKDPYQIVVGTRLLAEMGDPSAAKPIIDAYLAVPEVRRVPADLPYSLKAFGEPASRLVLAGLDAGKNELIPLAGIVCGPAAVPKLVELAGRQGRDLAYYETIAWALGGTQSPKAIDTLVELYKMKDLSGSLGCVHYALRNIGKAGASRFVEILQGNSDPAIRAVMMDMVEEFQVREAIPTLAAIAGDQKLDWSGLRSSALSALSSFPDNGHADLFFRATQENLPNEWASTAAVVGLGNSGDARAGPLLRERIERSIRGDYPSMLESMGRCRWSEAPEYLIKFLPRTGERGGLRVTYTLKGLGHTGDRRAAKTVLDWLQTNFPEHRGSAEDDASVRAAIDALGELGAEEAIETLERIKNVAFYSICGNYGPRYSYRELATNAIEAIRRAARERGKPNAP